PATKGQPWSLTLGMNEVFESNVRLGAADGGGDSASQLQAAASRDWLFGRADVKLTGNVSRLFYRQDVDLNQLIYGAGVAASYPFTRRLLWSGRDTFTSTYAQDAKVLTDGGLVLPKVVTHVNAASSRWTYDLSPRTRVQGDVGVQRISFDSTQFATSSLVTMRISVTRQFSQSETLGISYGSTIA